MNNFSSQKKKIFLNIDQSPLKFYKLVVKSNAIYSIGKYK